jgi:hypothetical protein
LIITIPPNTNTPVTLKSYFNSGRIYLATQEIQFFIDSSNRLVEPSPVPAICHAWLKPRAKSPTPFQSPSTVQGT